MNDVEEGLKYEWSILQNQTHSYEQYSLVIKLFSVGLLGTAYISNHMGVFVLSILLLIWLQDAIWKTYQSRIESRLLDIENCILNNTREKACQLHSNYENNRAVGTELVAEYLTQAIRPTVAFPHVALVLISIIFL